MITNLDFDLNYNIPKLLLVTTNSLITKHLELSFAKW